MLSILLEIWIFIGKAILLFGGIAGATLLLTGIIYIFGWLSFKVSDLISVEKEGK